MEAALVEVVGDTLHPQEADGTRFRIQIAKLCPADQNLVRSLSHRLDKPIAGILAYGGWLGDPSCKTNKYADADR